jgi:thioredoxin-like negative regulator of GroEL
MRVRIAYLLLVVVGCHSTQAPSEDAPTLAAAQLREAPKPLLEVLRTSAAQPPPPPEEPEREPDDALTLAARCIARDDIRGATAHLDAYVRAHPDQPLYRFQLAELCVRGDRPADARFHYEEFTRSAQDAPALRPQRVTAHTRLMEMAQRSGDRFGELFHRGTGLLLIVEQMDALKEQDETFCEEMLCKALQALRGAKEWKPADPRVRVYLAGVYARMGNPSAARAERAAAKAAATAGELTPTEARPLFE